MPTEFEELYKTVPKMYVKYFLHFGFSNGNMYAIESMYEAIKNKHDPVLMDTFLNSQNEADEFTSLIKAIFTPTLYF
jgi:hypothetical protein